MKATARIEKWLKWSKVQSSVDQHPSAMASARSVVFPRRKIVGSSWLA